ncbi:hypothetical protein UC34_14155 [Pandoraea vervacti]|uniref:Bacteriocin n=1 Tax=Pandoraea vervacti TaxID=656178 RepID=A0ABN4FSU2_9BURK|nr:hypothetical protein UC34_14155 [Pandoraea vervacti]
MEKELQPGKLGDSTEVDKRTVAELTEGEMAQVSGGFGESFGGRAVPVATPNSNNARFGPTQRPGTR